MPQLRPLEVLQNEAMRIILGCLRTAKLEVLRAELHLPSIVSRIQEIACRTVARMLCSGSPSLRQSLDLLYHNPRSTANPYIKKLTAVLTRVGLVEACLGLTRTPQLAAWNTHRVSVDIHQLPASKLPSFHMYCKTNSSQKLRSIPMSKLFMYTAMDR